MCFSFSCMLMLKTEFSGYSSEQTLTLQASNIQYPPISPLLTSSQSLQNFTTLKHLKTIFPSLSVDSTNDSPGGNEFQWVSF